MQFSPDKRFVYLASNIGWIGQFDIASLKFERQALMGESINKLSISSNGRYLMVVKPQQLSLAILSTDNLLTIKQIPISNIDNQPISVSSIHDALGRKSFIVTFNGIDEFWEIFYQDNPLPVYNGLMHDYRLGEGMAKQPDNFPIRRIKLAECKGSCFESLIFYPPSGLIIISKQKLLQVIQLDARRTIAEINLDVSVSLGTSIIFKYNNNPVLATTRFDNTEIIFIDLTKWIVINRVKTSELINSLTSHEASKFIWVSVHIEAQKDLINIIDKDTLDIVKTLGPFTNKEISNVQFGCGGECVIIRVGRHEKEIVIFDATTLNETGRFSI